MVVIHKKHQESEQEKSARLQKEQEQAMGLQDHYQARGFELVSWVQDHKIIVSLMIAALFLAGALFSGYVYYQKRNAEMASAAYLSALKEVSEHDPSKEEDKAKLVEAQKRLAEVAGSYGRSGVSVLANLYGAHLALLNNDIQGSVAMYQGALAKLNTADAVYPLAQIGLGYAQEKSGDSVAALASFERVLDSKSGLGNDVALWEAARLAKNTKDLDKAKKYIARLLEEYPASVYEKNAKRLKAEVLQ